MPGRFPLSALVAILLAAAGCGEIASGPRGPVVDSVVDATGDGVAVIGEDVELVGSGLSAADLRVTVDGREARVLERSPSRTVVRVPPGSGVGEVPVVARDAAGESAPVGLVVRRLAWATNFTDRSVSALSVDGTSVELLGRVPIEIPPGPFAVEFSPDGATAVVACSSGFLPPSIVQALAPGAPPGDTVAIVDVSTGAVRATVRTGVASRPTGIAIAPDGSEAWVTNYATSTITVIDLAAGRAVAEIPVPRQPEELAVDGDGRHLLVASDAGTASVVDTRSRTVISTFSTGGNDPSGVALSADGRTGWVTNSFTDASLGEDGTLSVVDLSDPAAPRVVSTITDGIGPTPYDVRRSPDGRRAVVTDLAVIFSPLLIGPGSLSLLDLGAEPTVVAVIPVGTAPIHAKFTPSGDAILAGNGLSQTISVVDVARAEVVDTIALGTSIGPADIAIQP
ncbi:MAG: hypothetical protein ACKPBU_08870 [Alphaproteobacteria bacterium]